MRQAFQRDLGCVISIGADGEYLAWKEKKDQVAVRLLLSRRRGQIYFCYFRLYQQCTNDIFDFLSFIANSLGRSQVQWSSIDDSSQPRLTEAWAFQGMLCCHSFHSFLVHAFVKVLAPDQGFKLIQTALQSSDCFRRVSSGMLIGTILSLEVSDANDLI